MHGNKELRGPLPLRTTDKRLKTTALILFFGFFARRGNGHALPASQARAAPLHSRHNASPWKRRNTMEGMEYQEGDPAGS